MNISVRECIAADIDKIVDYFFNADKDFLKGMGADKSKLPNREKWTQNLHSELVKPYKEKSTYYIIWLLDDAPIGHSNINRISFGNAANMHLHVWNGKKRQSGLGLKFLKMTLPLYFEKFELNTLICEPYTENSAPNKTLKKLGFNFVKTYETIPGLINFRQNVNRYELTKEELHTLVNT